MIKMKCSKLQKRWWALKIFLVEKHVSITWKLCFVVWDFVSLPLETTTTFSLSSYSILYYVWVVICSNDSPCLLLQGNWWVAFSFALPKFCASSVMWISMRHTNSWPPHHQKSSNKFIGTILAKQTLTPISSIHVMHHSKYMHDLIKVCHSWTTLLCAANWLGMTVQQNCSIPWLCPHWIHIFLY